MDRRSIGAHELQAVDGERGAAVVRAVRYLRERVIRAQVPNWAAAWRTLAGFDVADRLRELRVPTHVIAAEGDGHTTGPQAMKALAEHIPQAKFSIVAGAPHLSPLVKPHEVATLLAHS
jgi:3-oxoadipate enol-lactonase